MQKAGILILVILILFVFTTSASAAKIRIIDVIHLTDGSKITGKIIGYTPNDYVKIETIDNEIKTYRFTQIKKMKVLKVRLNLKPRSRTLATTLAVGPAILQYGLVLQGFGQLYNSQYLKAGGFFLNAVMGAKILLESETSNTMTVIGVGMVAGGYIWSITDISSGY